MRLDYKIFIIIVGLSLSCKNNEVTTDERIPITHTDSEMLKDIDEDKTDYIDFVTKAKDSVKSNKYIYSIVNDPFIKMTDSSFTIIGIVQSSGIRSFDKIDYKADFQIESFYKKFYLLTPLNLKSYWGKCVKIKGNLAHGWDLSMSDYDYQTFGRIPFELDMINEISCDSCSWIPYPKREIKSYTYEDKLKGYIIRGKRIAPDIRWDYWLKLDKSIPHPEDPKKSESNLSGLTIYPNINLDILNQIIEDSLHILTIGQIKGGYVESYVFITDSIVID